LGVTDVPRGDGSALSAPMVWCSICSRRPNATELQPPV